MIVASVVLVELVVMIAVVVLVLSAATSHAHTSIPTTGKRVRCVDAGGGMGAVRAELGRIKRGLRQDSWLFGRPGRQEGAL